MLQYLVCPTGFDNVKALAFHPSGQLRGSSDQGLLQIDIDSIQTGVDAGTINLEQAATIRSTVTSVNGEPLANVIITRTYALTEENFYERF